MIELPRLGSIAVALAVACSGSGDPRSARRDPDPPPSAPDAAPRADAHVEAAAPGTPWFGSSGPKRPIEIFLRSTPPGAIAAVDGRVIGPTPTFWRGATSDRPREFTFVLDDHAMARYRFVATTSGVVHATLEPLMDGADAGPR
jgi:hypothetical protein